MASRAFRRILESLQRRLGLRKGRMNSETQSAEKRRARRELARGLENLESRQLMVGEIPTLQPITDDGDPSTSVITLRNGSPLYIPLLGADPDSDALTYEVSVQTLTGSPTVSTRVTPQSNTTVQMDVQGIGTMKFRLFDDLVPRAVDQFKRLIENVYNVNPTTLYRAENNFVIQGGLRNPQNVKTVDDQFNVNLQFNRTGFLAYAKSTPDDSGSSEFFITEGDQRQSLDFNYPIFGLLTEGEATRAAVEALPTTASGGLNFINTPPTTRISVVDDRRTGVLELRGLGGTGTSRVTVVVRDAQGNQAQRSFDVTVVNDTFNSHPFLNDIAAINATAGSPINFQISAQDVENSPVTYGATRIGSVNYTVQANATTGEITVTPPVGYTGPLDVQVSVTDGTSAIDTQVVRINVAAAGVAAPTVNLDASSDTGASNSDDVTGAANLVFTVSGVTSGATVRLYEGNNRIGEAVASGTSTSITVSNFGSNRGIGVYNITATQVVGGAEGARSAPLNLTFDNVAGAFLNSAPTTARVGQSYVFRAQNAEAVATGWVYSLVSPPTGASINASTGEITWTPTAAQLGSQTLTIRGTDLAGNTRDLTTNVQVANPLAATLLRFTDANGNPITSIPVNGTFFLEGQAQDVRATPQGLFSVYYDVVYDSTRVSTTGAVVNVSPFTSAPTGSVATPGIIDEAGGFVGQSNPGTPGSVQTVFRVPMRANQAGSVTFSSNIAEGTASDFVVFGVGSELTDAQINFGSATLTVTSGFSVANDTFNLQEDAASTNLDVLANDTAQGSASPITITAVSTPSQGGTVTIASDGRSLNYRPAANFNGTETFTYTARSATNETQIATVTINVSAANDPPVANDDTFSATVGVQTSLNVLANDNGGPNENDTLTITGVGTGSKGGTIQIAPGGTTINYTSSASATGSETFTYTISDGRGGTATGRVTVNIQPANAGPSANNDTFNVQEESAATIFDVLANDSAAQGRTLTITGVGSPSRGGNVTVTNNGTRVSYTPAANFQGSETFTYSISDGAGGVATGTVTVNVANANDPPVAVNDTQRVGKNATAVRIEVLANDNSGVDPAETLIVSAVTQGSNGGTVAIGTGGSFVTYTPATDFLGTETFTYTIRDPGGLTSTATVTVTVVNFVPSDIRGFAFIDRNKNGSHESTDTAIVGVKIQLTGTDRDNQAVSLSTTTDMSGAYAFTGLAPGNYTVSRPDQTFLDKPTGSAGSSAGSSGQNGSITVNLPENTQAANYNFNELGRLPKFVYPWELFGSTPRTNITIAMNSSGANLWRQFGGTAWQNFSSVNVTKSTDGKSLNLVTNDSTNGQQNATISLADQRLVRNLGTDQGADLYRILGAPTAFGLKNPPTSTSGGTNGGSTAAPVVTTSSGATTFTENASPVVIDPTIGVADTDSQNLTGARVQISTGFTTGQDALAFSSQTGIVGNFDTATGILTFTGAASLATYQTLLRSVTYTNSSPNPSTTARTISFTVTDDSNPGKDSAVATKTVNVTAVNTAPLITLDPSTLNYTIGATPVTVDPSLTLTDADSPNMVSATVRIASGRVAGDTLSFTAQTGITGAFDSALGVLNLSGSASIDTYRTVLRSVAISTSASVPAGSRSISFLVNDGTTASAEVSRNVSVITGDAPSVVTTSAGATSFVRGGSAVAVDPGIVVTDSDSTTIAAATVTIASGYVSTADTLAFTSASGITGSFNSSSGVLSLTGQASLANYQSVLRSVTFVNSNASASLSPRTITFVVSQAGGAAPSNTATKTLNIVAPNAAPVNSLPSTAQSTAEDTPLSFSTANTNAVSISDADAGTAPVEVTLSVNNGVLRLTSIANLTFSAGDGTDDATMTFRGTVTDINAALNTLSYRPAQDFNGSATLQITTNDLGGTLGSNPQQDTDTLTITVTPVNDAPTLVAPTTRTTTQGGNVTFSGTGANGIVAADVDIGTALAQATLSAINGTLTVAPGTAASLNFSVGDGTADTTMTFTGTLANLNAALNGLVFTPNVNFTGQATVTITVNDQGNTGAGGSLSVTRDITITVNPPSQGELADEAFASLGAGDSSLSGSSSASDPMDPSLVDEVFANSNAD